MSAATNSSDLSLTWRFSAISSGHYQLHEDTMTCPSCQTPHKTNSNFCRHCGRPFAAPMAATMLSTTIADEAKTLLAAPQEAQNIQGGTLFNDGSTELEEAVFVAKLASGRLEGLKVAGYTIKRKLGEGGMGAVYEATHPKSKSIAIKILHADYAEDQRVVTRFFNEARAVNQIGNPHIVDISSFGRFPNNQPYMTMELLEGTDLAGRLQKQSPLYEAEAIDIVMQVLDALESTHKAGIIHRDLKPENIFLQKRPKDSGRWFVKVLDFGIAKLSSQPTQSQPGTALGVIMGTPAYMSPEQARGEKDLSFAADLYSLGVIFYELLAGRAPFEESNYLGYLVAHQRKTPLSLRALNSAISEETEQLVMRCLAKSPSDRFASAAQMKDELSRCLRALQKRGDAPMRLQTPARSNVVAPVEVKPVVVKGAPVAQEPTHIAARWIVAAAFSVALFGTLAYLAGNS